MVSWKLTGSWKSAASFISHKIPGFFLRRKWQLTPVFLPGKSHGAWQATVHGVTKSRTRLSDQTTWFLTGQVLKQSVLRQTRVSGHPQGTSLVLHLMFCLSTRDSVSWAIWLWAFSASRNQHLRHSSSGSLSQCSDGPLASALLVSLDSAWLSPCRGSLLWVSF